MGDKLRKAVELAVSDFGGSWASRHGTIWLDQSVIDRIADCVRPNWPREYAVVDSMIDAFRVEHEKRWGNFPMGH